MRLCGLIVVASAIIGIAIFLCARVPEIVRLQEANRIHERKGKELDEAARVMHETNQAKSDTVRSMLAGRLTLQDVIARFETLDAALPVPGPASPHRLGDSAREHYRRLVIRYVQDLLADDPAACAAAIAKLEAMSPG